MGSCRRCLSSGGPSQSWGHVSGFLMGSDKGWILARAVGPRGTSIRYIIILSIRGRIERICIEAAWGGEDRELDSGQRNRVQGPADPEDRSS